MISDPPSLAPTDSQSSLKQEDIQQPLDDTRVLGYDPLLPPQILQMEHPLTSHAKQIVCQARRRASRILKGEDDRLLVIVGPCSIHDTEAALEYGKRLSEISQKLSNHLVIIMRAYFEKPRTTVGWKGLINDPFMDGSFQINAGLRKARKLLCDLTELGVPVGCELLDTITPQFLGDLISWGAIGARTTESQLHRELASGVSFPVGFKNGTDGNISIAMDAIHAASHPHHFLGVTKQGLASITKTKGNDTCHVILRGGKSGPNYEASMIDQVKKQLESAQLPLKIMVDCSHGNSRKQHKNQCIVARDLCQQISGGDSSIFGIMLESNLNEGNQKIEDVKTLKYGVSVTDACIHWEDTVQLLNELAQAQAQRRQILLSLKSN